MSHALQLQDIAVAYAVPGGLRTVVDGLSLALAPGEIGCLLGASGCGKTTALRAIAGFEPLRAGQVLIDGTAVAGPGLSLPPERRRVGMMFQDYALFPHLTAAQNIAFGLRGLLSAQRAARVAELLALVGLPTAGTAYPHELSGGQQQRIALARALAPSPRVLLLDEPFSNLDADIRARLAADTRAVLAATGTTVLLVTHDQDEAFALADRVGVMDAGRLLQWDTPEALYARPAERRVAGFVGRGDWVRSESLGLPAGEDVRLRPGQLRPDPAGGIDAQLLAVAFRGPGYAARLRLAGGELLEIDVDAPPAADAPLRLRLQPGPSGLLRFPRGVLRAE
jgi:iron(III) transport system ATP-binding protein